ncbi:MAG: FecR domain-containing protein [Planctomycetota bacterium]
MKLPKETAELLEAYFAGDPPPEIIEAMEAWLREDPGHPRLLAEYGLVDRLIAHEQKKQDASAIFASLLEAEEAAETIVLDAPPSPVPTKNAHTDNDKLTFSKAASVLGYATAQSLRQHAVVVAAIAAVFVIAVVLIVALPSGNTTTDSPSITSKSGEPGPVGPALNRIVATLTTERDAVWSTESAEGALAPGSQLQAGRRLTLKKGFAEITTNRGAVAIVEAPATIELYDNENALRLHNGKLVGICETDTSKGFLVHTPTLDVTDLGTRFGIVVDRAGSTLAKVFTGSITVKQVGKEADGAAPRVLAANESVAFDAAGQEIRADKFTDVVFTRQRLRQHTIVSARLQGIEEFEPRVLAQGFWDGQKIFTDRNFVLTGVAAGGLPAKLQGADIVQMPGDARSRISTVTEFQLELELSRPSDIYLLISERQPEPDWLTRDYESTGEDVGVRFSEGRTDRYAIWKRKAVASGRTIAAEDVDISMYGVVVVPVGSEPAPD